MGFLNLYTKKTANPKEIDFARVGTIVKNKIPEAAIKAFLAKVPGTQAKAFEFTFDKDGETGKMQIAVKSLGFVYGWVDADFVNNKAQMKVAETEIAGWKGKVDAANLGVLKHQKDVREWSQVLDTLEGALASNAVNEETLKQHGYAKAELEEVRGEAEEQHKAMLQFWNNGPNKGVLGLMEKHGLSPGQIAGARKEAEDAYAAVQQSLKKYQEGVTAMGQALVAARKKCDDVGVKLTLMMNGKRDRKSELEELQVEIQKQIGEIQGYKNTDFAGVGAKALLQEAKEFMGKSGATWTKLSADPVALDKAAKRTAQGVFERMRVLGGRVVQEYTAWQKPAIPRRENMPKYLQMLQMVRDEYMADQTTLQNTLREYTQALFEIQAEGGGSGSEGGEVASESGGEAGEGDREGAGEGWKGEISGSARVRACDAVF